MFWNKKDGKEGLPDLPPLKTPLRAPFETPRRTDLFEMENIPMREESHPLPAFSDSSSEKPFSQEEIKDAVNEPKEEYPREETTQNQEVSALPVNRMRTMEMESPSVPMKAQRPFMLDSPPEENAYIPPKRPMQKTNEIFVKLERFNSAHRSIIGIRKKIDEIDSALKRIREIKMREEQELVAWEKEISSLKSRLQEVNDTLFE